METIHTTIQPEKAQLAITHLNELLNLNCERIKGYRKALNQCESNATIICMLERNIESSLLFAEAITEEILSVKGRYNYAPYYAAKLHRLWMDVKEVLFPYNEISILSSCRFGDFIAISAYDHALNSSAAFSTSIRENIRLQKKNIEAAHDEINELLQLTKTLA